MFWTVKKVSMTIIVLTFFCGNLALAQAPIYITQVQITGGKGKTELDFIELFNANTERLNLKSYRLVKRTQEGGSDVLIKVWTKDTFIPAKSFYLWANKSYSGIRVDSNSSATISEDNGVGLRNGAKDTGQLVDSLSWGMANNGFNKVININPQAGQSIQRKDRYSTSSGYFISSSNPHNSTVNDLAVEFLNSQNKKESAVIPKVLTTEKVILETQVLGTSVSATITPAIEDEGEIVEGALANPGTPLPTKKQTNYLNKYLFMVCGSLILLVYFLVGYVFKKKE